MLYRILKGQSYLAFCSSTSEKLSSIKNDVVVVGVIVVGVVVAVGVIVVVSVVVVVAVVAVVVVVVRHPSFVRRLPKLIDM